MTVTHDTPSVVYFLRRSDGAVKIGTTTNLVSRVKALETACGPLAVLHVEPGGYELERAYHRRFDAERVHGEWFACAGCDADDCVHWFLDELGDLAHHRAVATWLWDTRQWELMILWIATVDDIAGDGVEKAIDRIRGAITAVDADVAAGVRHLAALYGPTIDAAYEGRT